MPRTFLRTAQVASRYNCSIRSIQRKVSEGILPAPYYFGDRFPRFAEDELEERERQAAAQRTKSEPREAA